MLEISALEGARTKGQRGRVLVGLTPGTQRAILGFGPHHSFRSCLVVYWHHLAVAMDQASHPEQDSGAPRKPGPPPSDPAKKPHPIYDSVTSLRSCSLWQVGGYRSDLQAYSCLSSAHHFSVAPQYLGRKHIQATSLTSLAFPEPPCASAEP